MNLSREVCKLIAENGSELIRILNNNFEIEYYNKEAHFKILGYSKEDLDGKIEYSFIHPNENIDNNSFLKEVKKEKNLTLECRYKHKNGNWIWIEFRGKIVQENQNSKKYLVISRDITANREYETYFPTTKRIPIMNTVTMIFLYILP